MDDYERFARSFTQIRAPDIRSQVEAIYANRFWPQPLMRINPHCERGASIADLAAEGTLYPDTAHRRLLRAPQAAAPPTSVINARRFIPYIVLGRPSGNLL
jgi:hypothetical protein